MSTTARHRSTRRGRAALVGLAVVGIGAAGLVGGPALAIDSNPPTGPGNIEIFPKRDMVAIEGYNEYAGKTALITVKRGNQTIGSTKGVVDATGFLEVNHPGGVCWGNDTNLKVTPDIEGGDEVRVDFESTGGRWDGATTSTAKITKVTTDEAQHSITISGTYGADVAVPGDLVSPAGRMQVEIVNPDMRNPSSGIGERAIGWPVDEQPTGYQVTGDASNGAFAVTWTFRDAADLELAAAGEAVVVAWQADDPDPNIEGAYGNTLYEFYESSGPGFGGCPAGPEGMTAESPTDIQGRGAGPGAVQVRWGDAFLAPGAADITEYRVRAVDVAGNEVGKRLPKEAREVGFEGLVANEMYNVEVTAVNTHGESWVPATVRIKAADHVEPAATASTARTPEDNGQYLPLVQNNQGDFRVTLDTVEGMAAGASIYYTTDGSTPAIGKGTTTRYTGPLSIRTDTMLRWVVLDSGNVLGPVAEKHFDIVDATIATPTVVSVVPGDASATVELGTVTGADLYRVHTYTGGVKVSEVNVQLPADGTVPATLTRRVANLTNGTAYTFTVSARSEGRWTPESAASEPVTPVAGNKADAGAPQTVLRGRTVTLDASGSVNATGYAWQQLRPAANGTNPQDPTAVNLVGTTTAKPTFQFPLVTESHRTSTDRTLTFRVTVTFSDGTTRNATVDVTGQPDSVTATEARWRAGNPIRMSGTGSQPGARLTFVDRDAQGNLRNNLGTVTVANNGSWAFPSQTVTLTSGSIYVWSDHGYQGIITTTR